MYEWFVFWFILIELKLKYVHLNLTSYYFILSFQNLLRREPLKLVDGGESQRTFIYIKDAIEAVLLMIVSLPSIFFHVNFSDA